MYMFAIVTMTTVTDLPKDVNERVSQNTLPELLNLILNTLYFNNLFSDVSNGSIFHLENL